MCALFFFIDPLTPMPHEVKDLIRLATLHDIPLATAPCTPDLIISGLVGTGDAPPE
jgi:methylglyoxal synthase